MSHVSLSEGGAEAHVDPGCAGGIGYGAEEIGLKAAQLQPVKHATELMLAAAVFPG
jgi:hypothetical protein